MTDIYDALLGGDDNTPASNADLVARLRQQSSLGQLAQLSGIAGLQKMGPSLQASADSQADLLYKTREMAQAKKDALEQAASLASERELDRMNIADQASKDRALQRTLSENETIQHLEAGRQTLTDKAAVAGQKVKDNASNAAAGIDSTIEAIDRLRAHPGLDKNYGLMGQIPNYPGGDAASAKALIEGLTSMEGLQGMAAMRQQGGTFGRTTNIEFQALKDSIAPLADRSQNAQQVHDTLDLYKNKLLAAKTRLLAAADADVAAGAGGGSTVSQGFLKGSALPLSRGAPAAPAMSAAARAKALGLGQ